MNGNVCFSSVVLTTGECVAQTYLVYLTSGTQLTISQLQPSIHLHRFVFDENYAHLHSQGSAINLSKWYDGIPRILGLLFVTGTDDLALVEGNGRVRMFSLATQMFRYDFWSFI